MGNEENDLEPAAEHVSKDAKQLVVEKEPSGEQNSRPPSENTDPLTIYNWHTNTKGTPGEGKGDGGATAEASPMMDKVQKSSTSKWSKMQNWRKALSDDFGDKYSSSPEKSGAGAKPEKAHGPHKNPFRRVRSEPSGSLFAFLTASSSSGSGHATPSTGTTDALGASAMDASQRGGGETRFRKCLKTVSQKLKRPRLQSRHSTHNLMPDMVENELLRLQWAPPQEVPLWDISNCILEDGQILISPEDEPLMWTRNRVSSCLSNLSMQNIAEINTECSPDPVGQGGGARLKTQEGGVRALIKRRLEGRAKRNSASQINQIGMNSRLYGSRESVSIPVSVAGSLDLSADTSTVIRPVHSSILGEKYCFEVINSENNHCFGCTSAAERDRWIEDLRRSAQPNKDNIERTENSLSLWVNEAKDLQPKRCYFWEVHLDGTLFARTSSRAIDKCAQRSSIAGDGAIGASGGPGGSSSQAGGCQLFWGELFELDNLPSVSQVTLYLFRDEDPKKKRLSRDESCLHPLGSVAISLAEIRGRAYQEKWHPITPYKALGSGSSSKELLGPQASLRIKARFQNLKVLPMERYKEFAEFVTLDYVEMCQSLEPLLSVRQKEELAGALVHVLQSIGKAEEFLVDLGGAEVERLGEKEALIFRENTLATKAIDEYMKLVGQKYLIDTLGHSIVGLYESVESCEVDPLKCTSTDLSSNQRHLTETCEEVVKKITEMHGSFPEELNKVFSSWVARCEDQGRPEIGHRLISASLFLRFLCPAILSPSLFGLTQPYPEPLTLRTLTLTAKVIQNLANFTLFGEKEAYMLFMNDFLQQQWEAMRGFLQAVSNPDSDLPMASFDGYVDLPLRLAVLHELLVDIISKKEQNTIDQLHPLPSILNNITESLSFDAPRIPVSSPGQTKPTYVPPKDLSKYSPHQSSLQQLPIESKGLRDGDGRTRRNTRERKPVTRTQSAPYRRPGQNRFPPKRQASTEDLQIDDPEQEHVPVAAQQLDISSPQTGVSIKPAPKPVPWIKHNHKKEVGEIEKREYEQHNSLGRHVEELSELRLGVEQVTERELEMAKRLEDFIVQSLEQNEMLQAEVEELRNTVASGEEQLASTTYRLGMIEEEREEDERKLNVAMAAAERINVLEEQLADMLKELHRLNKEASTKNNILQPSESPVNSD
ncbi:Disabled 2-interacting protein [Merluccius polli]|uniref:Disabled 2-interacting protein n=1 Tax=Merluccius polli TaxID=89951 RepID=A0AA47M1D8_MERPO|nr:Disabled 2-interacting protein [Merluccius polli]